MGKKAVKVINDKITEIQLKEATELSDINVSFVSLVSHGANGEPFLIIKSKKEDEKEFTEKVIQRVIIAKDLDEEEKTEILLTKGLKNVAKTEYDTYEAYDQFAKDDCEPGSFSGVSLYNGKVVLITAKLKEEKELELFKEGGEKPRVEKKCVDISKAGVSWEIGYKIYDEISAMAGLIQGTLAQGDADLSWRKSTVKQAVTNFASAVEAIMDSITEEDMEKTAKILAERLKGLTVLEETLETLKSATKILSNQVTMIKSNKEDSDMTLTELLQQPEDAQVLKDLIRETIDAYVTEKAATDAAKKASEEADAAKKAAEETIKTLKETVDTLTAEVETLKNGVADPGSQAGDDPEGDAANAPAADEKPEDAVWKGLFMRPEEVAA